MTPQRRYHSPRRGRWRRWRAGSTGWSPRAQLPRLGLHEGRGPAAGGALARLLRLYTGRLRRRPSRADADSRPARRRAGVRAAGAAEPPRGRRRATAAALLAAVRGHGASARGSRATASSVHRSRRHPRRGSRHRPRHPGRPASRARSSTSPTCSARSGSPRPCTRPRSRRGVRPEGARARPRPAARTQGRRRLARPAAYRPDPRFTALAGGAPLRSSSASATACRRRRPTSGSAAARSTPTGRTSAWPSRSTAARRTPPAGPSTRTALATGALAAQGIQRRARDLARPRRRGAPGRRAARDQGRRARAAGSRPAPACA